MKPEPEEKTTLGDYAEIASTLIEGKRPVVVGGHAVSAWAQAYAVRTGEALRPYEPFLSRDLDLYGSREDLAALAKKYGVPVKYSEPRHPGIGQILIPKGNLLLKVEMLRSVRGVRTIDGHNTVDLVVKDITIRVLDPVACLKAKIANVVSIDQQGRQDVKHVQILKICAREFTKDIMRIGTEHMTAADRIASERKVVNYLEGLRETLTSTEAQAVTRKWNIAFTDVLPLEAIRACPMEKVQSFVRYRLEEKSQKITPDSGPQEGPRGPRIGL